MHLRAALIVVAALVLSGCGAGSKTVTGGAPTTPAPATTPGPEPAPAPATTATATAPTTPTTPAPTPAGSPNSHTRLAAEKLARYAASQEARKQGVRASPGEWHAECAPAAGGDFDCHVSFNGGQCQGRVHVTRGPTGPAVSDRKVGCRE